MELRRRKGKIIQTESSNDLFRLLHITTHEWKASFLNIHMWLAMKRLELNGEVLFYRINFNHRLKLHPNRNSPRLLPNNCKPIPVNHFANDP
jgi:hypothetical protein